MSVIREINGIPINQIEMKSVKMKMIFQIQIIAIYVGHFLFQGNNRNFNAKTLKYIK